MSKLIIITGTSASGKSTIVQEILSRKLIDAIRFITCTTRIPRPDETNGISYWFMSRQDFERELHAEHFFEHALVYGNYYGSSKKQLEEMLHGEKTVLMILDVQGVQTVKKLYPAAKVIFIDAPDEVLKKRLEARNPGISDFTERFKNIEKERLFKGACDAVILNDEGHLEETLQTLLTKITF